MRLQIRNATVEYGANVVLERVSFEIHDREKIAVVGRNGCGKTTFLKLITGEVSPVNPASDESFAFIMAGGQQIGTLSQINFTDREITAREEIKKVFTPIYECRIRMREIENLLGAKGNGEADTELNRLLSEYSDLQKKFDALGGNDAEREMEIMFKQFGFGPEELDKPMGMFSGGQQTKIAFIKLLLSKPDILLLDEPTNHLDLPTIEWLEGYLKKYEKAVVIVSHDRAFLDNVTTITYEIEYGRMKRYAGNYTTFVRLKEEALIKQEKDYEAQQKEIKRLSDWVEKWKNTPTKVSTAHSKEKAIEHMVLIEKPRRFDTTTFRAHFSPRIQSYSDVLSARKLVIGYDRPLSEVSFELKKHERLAIVGENGKGKSTLLKTLTGEVEPLSGTFKVGTNVEMGYYDQQRAVINNEDPEQTILDNFWDEYPQLKNEEVRSTLGAFAFSGEEVEKKLGVLSGGEKVRLSLCKMFFTKPNLLVLDEPTNHMDILGKESLEKMLTAYEGTLIFVSHDRYFVNKIATKILDISTGKMWDVEAGGDFFGSEEYNRHLRESEAIKDDARRTRNDESSAGRASNQNQDLIKNPGKVRSKLEHKIEKLQIKADEAGKAVEKLKSEMNDPALSADYEKLMKLQEELSLAEAEEERILEEMIEAEEELEGLKL